MWIFAIIWNAVSTPVLIFVPREFAAGNRLVIMALLFPLVGVVIIVAAVRETLRTLRFRRSSLLLDEVPVPIGGVLRGQVEVPGATDVLGKASSIAARLTCYSRTSDSESTSESVLWQEEMEIEPVELRRTEKGISIPIEFEIPEDAQSTDESDRSSQTIWRLRVDGDVPGIDYTATFDVPVFRSAGATLQRRSVAPRPLKPPEERTVRERENSQVLELSFPPFRNPGVAIGTFFFTSSGSARLSSCCT